MENIIEGQNANAFLMNIIFLWIISLYLMYCNSYTSSIHDSQAKRIRYLEVQNKAITHAIDKINNRVTVAVKKDEILGLRYEIASLTAEMRKKKMNSKSSDIFA